MLHTLAIHGYRSLKDVVIPLGQLNLITGPNGSGKSSVYRALRLLADTAQGKLIRTLAKEGGLKSTLWAGPEKFSRAMREGTTPVQGGRRSKPVRLQLGFSGDEFSYTLDLGLPSPMNSAFGLDPIIKRECLWRGPSQRARDLCADRRGPNLRCRGGDSKDWREIFVPLTNYSSMLTEYADPEIAPELILMRDAIRSWRFYDHFRTDADAPVRRSDVGTFTPVLASDGSDLAAALQTIFEIGDSTALSDAITDAFPGSKLTIDCHETRFEIALKQTGMLRPLCSAELSDGTLRFLLLVAALLTSRPPELMVLNEPETSLHPDLIPALGRLICQYACEHQIIVVTHSAQLIETLAENENCSHFELEKPFGATELAGIDPLELPLWKWPAR